MTKKSNKCPEKILVWYLDNGYDRFSLFYEDDANNLDEIESYKVIKQWKISKPGFSIKMIGNLTQGNITTYKGSWGGEWIDESDDNVLRMSYIPLENEPSLSMFKNEIIEHIDNILENWI